MKKIFIFNALFLVILGSCKYSPAPTNEQSISLTFHNMKPSRPGEVYALWAEIPKSAAPLPKPQHGTNIIKLVSTFTVNDTGGIVGLDLANAKSKIGVDFALISRIEISIENPDSIEDDEKAIYLVGDVTGSSSIGNATLHGDDPLALGTGFNSITGLATLATSTKTPTRYKSEVYLMDATSSTETKPGLSDPLPFLPGTWRYGVWTIDSAATTPISFLGYVDAIDSKDSKSAKDNFNYPGGVSPFDAAINLYDLTNGKSAVLLTLEPAVHSTDPVIPFSAPVLFGLVPLDQQAFQPFSLQNVASGFPTVDVKIIR
jgi:hypothetical protein